ncbi:hypothetical protein, partial [Methylobacterium sp. CG08_land_8_20_14_0_20_71_15]
IGLPESPTPTVAGTGVEAAAVAAGLTVGAREPAPGRAAPGIGGAPLPLFNPFLARRMPPRRTRRRGQEGNGLWAILRVLGWDRREDEASEEPAPDEETRRRDGEGHPSPGRAGSRLR